MANETHESGALLIFFSIENSAGRKFRIVVWPEDSGRMRMPDFEELKKDALGLPMWAEVDIVEDSRIRLVAIEVLATALHKGAIPAAGIDLGVVKP